MQLQLSSRLEAMQSSFRPLRNNGTRPFVGRGDDELFVVQYWTLYSSVAHLFGSSEGAKFYESDESINSVTQTNAFPSRVESVIQKMKIGEKLLLLPTRIHCNIVLKVML